MGKAPNPLAVLADIVEKTQRASPGAVSAMDLSRSVAAQMLNDLSAEERERLEAQIKAAVVCPDTGLPN